jgi:predicted patatin/cPLA2 family phospholipase
VLKATKALPIVYGKKITIGESQYVDHSFPLHELIESQKENLEGKIVVVDVREKTGIFPILYRILSGRKKGEEFSTTNVFTIRPKHIHAHLLSNSHQVLERTFMEGHQYAISHEKELLEYLNSLY